MATTGTTAAASQPAGTPQGTPSPDPKAAAALSALLAVEHAAMYGASSAGGALAPLGAPARDARGLALAAYAAHRELRDRLTELILDAGGEPPAALPAYTLPVRPVDVQSALTLLAELDDRTAAAAYDAVGAVTGPARELVVDALGQAALRALRARLTAGANPVTVLPALPGRP
ncbi:DUF4439 domain-containing protein [Frankia sp. CNm7]|uniref:DUF4439 domain-containing protein n=1 Tax=Frankia nepalensis TaxID=1836974 RepID=A0A937UM89_9ACTN|nr:DUF4439 domain-containing protein [Frankia nepalensis]MBL7497050.1 DUF4439 domain-containing protein [Frankia nepalensis]MBL7514149.1 DUF4439 domain-containing protein [Frankia nepalensis]MBL7523516.1 DUF4439 domain-containing protein [Frankia nepalensis]MBL7628634.1 DUF4439 domain-containing protein [Frankia nepalensis]